MRRKDRKRAAQHLYHAGMHDLDHLFGVVANCREGVLLRISGEMFALHACGLISGEQYEAYRDLEESIKEIASRQGGLFHE